jgi:hypothetical protein
MFNIHLEHDGGTKSARTRIRRGWAWNPCPG